MKWFIHMDGCFVAESNGHSFELGEMGGGRWLLKHWLPKSFPSVWHDVWSEDEGKAMAERLANV